MSCVHVIDKMPCSDHLPIAATRFDICNKLPEAQSRMVDKDSKADANCIKEYGNVSQQVSIPKAAMHCSNTHCTEAAHRYNADICRAPIFVRLCWRLAWAV